MHRLNGLWGRYRRSKHRKSLTCLKFDVIHCSFISISGSKWRIFSEKLGFTVRVSGVMVKVRVRASVWVRVMVGVSCLYSA